MQVKNCFDQKPKAMELAWTNNTKTKRLESAKIT